jgi:polar amino acid transport system substrate-binding protein
MKKILWLAVLITILASLVLTSCSSGDNSISPAAATSLSLMNITVATYADWAPFEYVDEHTKQIIGFDIDIFNAIASKQNLKIEYKNVAFDPLLAGMAQGMYDAAISSIIITEDYKKGMLFSDPYFAAGQIIVVLKNNTVITDKDTLKGTVGVQSDTIGDIEVKKIAAITSKPYDKIEAAFQDLIDGHLDAVVCENPIARVYIGRNPDKLKTVGQVFTGENYGIAVANGKNDLLNRIDAGLKVIKAEGIIDQSARKWLK